MRKMTKEFLEDNEDNHGAFVDLTCRRAFTFHLANCQRGCNAARVCFEPESKFPGNEGAAATLDILKTVSDAHPDASNTDLIVLAGQAALQQAGATTLAFCGGRIDVQDGSGSKGLAPRIHKPAVVSICDNMEVKGLTARQGVAFLASRPTGSALSNQFFVNLLAEDGDGTFTKEELALLKGEFETTVEEFAANEQAFMEVFASAWTHLMTADCHGERNKNSCAGVDERLPCCQFL
jgi:catalase (peroxidase I)